MEYYSAIKRNTRESVPMKWMNLEPIIQSEVATKRKTNIGNAGLDEAQAGIKIAGRNINILRYAVEKAMAPHSSTFAWKIPWTEEPGRLWSMGS